MQQGHLSYAVVTGASSGIGAEVAKRLAKKKYSLVLLARRVERLLLLKTECIEAGSPDVKCVEIDLADRAQLNSKIESGRFLQGIEADSVSVLVNNAGLALGMDPLENVETSDVLQMIDTNFTSVSLLTKFLLPSLKKGNGHIVNIGSVAGLWSYPGGAVYCATKAAIKAFSEGLRLDAMGTGLRVTNIEPGMVNTEFSLVRLKNKEAADRVYQNMTPLYAADIADAVLWSLDRPVHVNIQEMVIFPTDQAGVGYVHRSPY